MKYFPFENIEEDRAQLSIRYGLMENVNGVYRLTSKCKKNYDEMSYLKYLTGLVSEPTKIGKDTIIQDLLSM